MATGYLRSLLGEDEYETAQQSAFNNALLMAGLQGLISSGPSLTPTSTGQIIGQAGMAGLGAYGDALAQAEEQGLRGMEFAELQKEQQANEAFNAALPEIFKNGKIDYQSLQRLALVNPERTGQVIQAYKSAQPPRPAAPKTAIREITNEQGQKVTVLLNEGTGEIIRQIGGAIGVAPDYQVDIPRGVAVNKNDPTQVIKLPGIELSENPSAADVNKAVIEARKEFTGLPPVKVFQDQTQAYGRIIASATDPSPAGDLALIFNYMKMLDPGSTVREGEAASARNAGGVDERIRSAYNNLLDGTQLTPDQRSDFINRSNMIYQDAERQYQNIETQYKAFAQAAGLPVDRVIPNFRYSSKNPNIPPPPKGVSQTDWIGLWENMTPEERAEFKRTN